MTVATSLDVPTDQKAAPQKDGYEVRVEMSDGDYKTLLDGAAKAGMSPADFLIKSIQEGAFIADQRQKGNRILVQSRKGLRELVD